MTAKENFIASDEAKMSKKDFNAWKYVKVNKKSLENNPYLNPKKAEKTKEEPEIILPKSEIIKGSYDLVKADTYAQGLHIVMEDNKKGLCLPVLSFKQNLELRINEFESNNKNKLDEDSLFDAWLDSCTGIAYKKGSTKFKIIPVCNGLLKIPKDFNQSYLPVDYDKIQGIELNSSVKNVKCDELLTKSQILKHPAWLAAVENDKQLLKTYRDIVFSLKPNKNELMGFWIRDQPTTDDELRALCVSSINNSSYADGSGNLSNSARFVRVAPQNFSTGNKGKKK